MADDDRNEGLYEKYHVRRHGDEGKHFKCEYFVLDWNHDRFAVPAARAYADACEKDYPQLAADLRTKADEAEKRWAENDKKEDPWQA
jgi:hypothetical protein